MVKPMSYVKIFSQLTLELWNFEREIDLNKKRIKFISYLQGTLHETGQLVNSSSISILLNPKFDHFSHGVFLWCSQVKSSFKGLWYVAESWQGTGSDVGCSTRITWFHLFVVVKLSTNIVRLIYVEMLLPKHCVIGIFVIKWENTNRYTPDFIYFDILFFSYYFISNTITDLFSDS